MKIIAKNLHLTSKIFSFKTPESTPWPPHCARDKTIGSSFARAPQSRWKINERKSIFHYSAHLSKRNDAKLQALRQAKLTAANMEHSKSIISSLWQYEKLFFFRTEAGDGARLGFPLRSVSTALHAIVAAKAALYKQLYNNRR